MMCKRHAGDGRLAPLMPDCPFWCMVLFLPGTTWHPLQAGLPDRTPTRPTSRRDRTHVRTRLPG